MLSGKNSSFTSEFNFQGICPSWSPDGVKDGFERPEGKPSCRLHSWGFDLHVCVPLQSKLFCLCQQPYHADNAMVSCDVCEEWLHLKCVGLSHAAAKNLRKYACPICASLKVRCPALCGRRQSVNTK